MMIYVLTFSLLSLGYGVWAILHPVEIAQRNEEFLASGTEAYFEQRRSWKAYGTTPSTSAAEITRRGRREIIFGVLGLCVAAVFYAFDQGAF